MKYLIPYFKFHANRIINCVPKVKSEEEEDNRKEAKDKGGTIAL